MRFLTETESAKFQIARNVAQDELDAADNEKRIGIAILSFIRFSMLDINNDWQPLPANIRMQLSNTIKISILSLITVAFYFFVKNAHWTIRVFAQEVMEKVTDALKVSPTVIFLSTVSVKSVFFINF